MRGRSVVVVGLSELAVACVLTGCVRSVPPPQAAPRASPPMPQAPGPTRAPPSILSAHFAVNDAPPLGGADGLPVVFSVELDASTVVASHFVVVRSDGTRARPVQARLSPASEADENRTVLLIGDFGGPRDRPATHVAVSGPLYSEDGDSLRGLVAPVLAFEAAPFIVFAELLQPSARRCAGAQAMVRTYWTEGLRALSPDAIARVAVHTEAGQTVRPARFDDQAPPGQDGAEDNVLDLCLAEPARPVRLTIEAGVLTDPAGHANGEVDVVLGRG